MNNLNNLANINRAANSDNNRDSHYKSNVGSGVKEGDYGSTEMQKNPFFNSNPKNFYPQGPNSGTSDKVVSPKDGYMKNNYDSNNQKNYNSNAYSTNDKLFSPMNLNSNENMKNNIIPNKLKN